MQTNFSNQRGFSLLELIITAAIVAVISTISAYTYTGYIETSKISQAETQIRALSFLIDDYANEYGEYPNTLSDIGSSDDLCSYGKDGKSKAPLRAKDSHDDIIYANVGGYIGLASEF